MWGGAYWGVRYWGTEYWGKVGAEPTAPSTDPGTRGGILVIKPHTRWGVRSQVVT